MSRYRSVFMLTLCVFLSFTTRSYAGCKGAAEVTGTREQTLRTLLSAKGESIFQMLSEATDSTGKQKFVLYLNNTAIDQNNPRSLYFAGITGDKVEKVTFTYDVSKYLQQLESQLTKPSENPIRPQVVDGCLNTLQLPEGAQGLHLNLFIQDPQSGISGAMDTLFAIRARNLVQPVLELNQTSLVRLRASRKVAHRDSTIWLRHVDGNVVEIIWEQFDKNVSGIVIGEYSQSVLYRWNDTGFRKAEILQPKQLDEQLKGALALTRCDSITPLRFKVFAEPPPNQPAP